MKATIINQQNDFRIPRAFLIKNTQKLIKATQSLNLKDKKFNKKLQLSQHLEINLVFVTAGHIRHLNADFRRKDKPTDVLSFASFDPECLGELIFCSEVIAQNAKANGWSQKHEYLYMLVHGFLHLMGMDHEVDNEAQKMFSLQDQIFNKLSPQKKVIPTVLD